VRYFLLILLAALLLSLLTGVTQVQPGEIAVVRRFGRVLDERPGPGLYVGLPWGLEQVDRVAIDEVRRVTVGYAKRDTDDPETIMPPGQLLTGDHNLVNAQAVLDYKVNEEEVVDFVVQGDRVEELIRRAAETALAEWVAARTVDDVLLRGKGELPEWLVEQTRKRIGDYRLGVTIRHASVTQLSPPTEVSAAFEAVTRAQNQIETDVNGAEQESQQLWRKALAVKYDLERMTDVYRKEQRVLAEAEARSFEERLRQYRRLSKDNPAYLNALWWDEMGRVYARMRENGRIDLLDNRLGPDGLDIVQFPPVPRKK
jgi:membrane protease subunit HflK